MQCSTYTQRVNPPSRSRSARAPRMAIALAQRTASRVTYGWDGPGMLMDQVSIGTLVSKGRPALSVECGQHEDPDTPRQARDITLRFLQKSGPDQPRYRNRDGASLPTLWPSCQTHAGISTRTVLRQFRPAPARSRSRARRGRNHFRSIVKRTCSCLRPTQSAARISFTWPMPKPSSPLKPRRKNEANPIPKALSSRRATEACPLQPSTG